MEWQHGRILVSDVDYQSHPIRKATRPATPLRVIGLDTEAWATGQCFMVATSLGDVFSFPQFPRCFFSRAYRNAVFVAYNLKYDEGALLQHLSLRELRELRAAGQVEHAGYTYRVIPGKMFSVRWGRNAFTVYDMLNFYSGSLESNARAHLGAGKAELETKAFYPEYVTDHWKEIGSYCVQDARLVKALADKILERFRSYGLQPRKLFSTAYVSYQYFSTHAPYVTVRRFWDHSREVLQFAMDAYNGGKFEVTRKGPGDFYEYDLVSAYPHEIARLVDISWARVERTAKPRKTAVYALLRVRGRIPLDVYSPVAQQRGAVNVYPVGELERTITLEEYAYLVRRGADLTILDGVWFLVDKKTRPYAKEIARLVDMKSAAKAAGRTLDYQTLKVMLNSLYGKMVQLTPAGDRLRASTCWNPIYAAIITANVRVRMSELQQSYPTICAVHTDSVISTAPLPFRETGTLGELSFEASGRGVILGSGIYQVGEKVRFRGFAARLDLLRLLDTPSDTITIHDRRPFTWNEAAFHGWSESTINRFEDLEKVVRVNFDRKRVWLRDWTTFRDSITRQVDSIPHSELTLS